MVWETIVQSQVKSYQRKRKKKYLIPLYLTQNKVQIKGRWNNPEKGVVPLPTFQCSNY